MNAYRLAALLLLAAPLAACSAGTVGTTPAGQPAARSNTIRPMDTIGGIGGNFSIMLMDAPPVINSAQLDHIYLAVSRIDSIKNGTAQTVLSFNQPRIVDVLAHQNDAGENLGSVLGAMTSYDGLNLVVDAARSYATAGQKWYSLLFTSGSTNSTVGAGATTATQGEGGTLVRMSVTQPYAVANAGNDGVQVDFNAYESLAAFNGSSLLARPTLFVTGKATEGRIKGVVMNASGAPVAGATVVAFGSDNKAGNVVSTAQDGTFLLHTLAAGTYHLKIYNDYVTAVGAEHVAANATAAQAPGGRFAPQDGPVVTVTSGTVTNSGTIAD